MNTKIIDAEWEEIEGSDQVAIAPVPTKKSKWKRIVCELIGIVVLSQIIARILFLLVYGV